MALKTTVVTRCKMIRPRRNDHRRDQKSSFCTVLLTKKRSSSSFVCYLPNAYFRSSPFFGLGSQIHRRRVVQYSISVQCNTFKGTVSRDFLLLVFLWISFPPAPEYPIKTVSNFFENSRRYSQVKVHHRYQRHRWQILPPVPLVLLTPVANNENSIRLQTL